MPSVAYDSQARLVNRIYFAIDDPRRPASHLTGPLARAGQAAPAEGAADDPRAAGAQLAPAGRRRVPRIDSSAIDYRTPPSLERFRRWLDTGVGVAGRPEWVFIKAHTHGAPETNAAMMLGGPFRQMLATRSTDSTTARRSACTSSPPARWPTSRSPRSTAESGNAGHFRDYRYLPVTAARRAAARGAARRTSRRLTASVTALTRAIVVHGGVQPELRVGFGVLDGGAADGELVQSAGDVVAAEVSEGRAVAGLARQPLGHVGERRRSANRIGQQVRFRAEHLPDPLPRVDQLAALRRPRAATPGSGGSRCAIRSSCPRSASRAPPPTT